jgi:alcohol dehydrogenase class IV
MAMAAMEGAMVFQKGLGAVHALSHPTGGLKGYRLHHGTLNAIYLPAVLRFNAPAVGDKYLRVAELMSLSEREANAEGVANAVSALNERLGIPKGLGAMGLEHDTIENIAQGALGDHCHLSTPRQPTKAEYIDLIEQSWS